jgi:hypothetical protein
MNGEKGSMSESHCVLKQHDKPATADKGMMWLKTLSCRHEAWRDVMKRFG